MHDLYCNFEDLAKKWVHNFSVSLLSKVPLARRSSALSSPCLVIVWSDILIVKILLLHYIFFSLACLNGTIRQNKRDSSSCGHIEVCFNHTWGVICDDQFTLDDAMVACRQLQFPLDR